MTETEYEITEPGGPNPYADGEAFAQDVVDEPQPRSLLARVAKTTVRMGQAAINWGKSQISRPSKDFTRLCLQFVRMCHNVPAKYLDAGTAWDLAKFKHPTSDPMSIPAAVPVFFETPGKADHVAETIGGGLCLTNDWGTDGKGRIRVARIADIAHAWGPLKGWTEDLNGVRVYEPPKKPTPPKPAKPVTKTPNIDAAIKSTDKAIGNAKHAGVKAHLKKAKAELTAARKLRKSL